MRDEFERNLRDRSQIHDLVRLARCVHAALEPADGIQIDAVFVLQDTAHPDARGLAVFLHPDPFAFEVSGLPDSGPGVDEDVAVAEHARGKDRDRDERKVAPQTLDDVMREGHFRGIEGPGLDHAGEDFRRGRDRHIAQIHAFRLDHAQVQRLHAVVRAAGEGHAQLAQGSSRGDGAYKSPCLCQGVGRGNSAGHKNFN